jgi:ribosomal protein S18 acetylase RimI-like enzyme
VTQPDGDDLDAIVALHILAFPGFFMTQLGPSFLRVYYQSVLDYSGGILLTESDQNGCIGFVAGFVDPASFYQTLRRRRVKLALAAAVRVVTHPHRLVTLLRNYRRAGEAEKRTSHPAVAELSSLAVRPDAAGRGVGRRLVGEFLSAATSRGAKRVVLTTDANNNDPVNRFYQKLGFECIRTFEPRRGRVLNEYSIETGRV